MPNAHYPTAFAVDEVALAELDALGEKLGRLVARDVIDVIGVVAGIKPAAIVGGDTTAVSTPLLDRLGVKTATSTAAEQLIYVSYRQELALDLAAAHERALAGDLEAHRQVGELLGYPETAIVYFLKRWESLDTDQPLPQHRPEEVEGTVSRRFQAFILSPDHYEEEVASYCQPLEQGPVL